MPSAINNGEGGSPLMSNITDRRVVADKLREAKALIERGWTQDAYARNAAGHDIGLEEEAERPVCWCALGAIREVGFTDAALEMFQAAIGMPAVVSWNDAPGRTQAEVLAAFDKAITLADSSQ